MEFKKIKGEITTPLRYPGGKSKALDKILPFIPEFKEFREPFVGGGSVFIAVKQRVSPKIPFIINDLNKDLSCFWKILQKDSDGLYNRVMEIKKNYPEKEKYMEFMKNTEWKTEFEKAVRFFIINRSSFSGLSDSGGFSKEAFEKRFTLSSIEKLKSYSLVLNNVKIEDDDYEKIINLNGEDVFIFLDPPYLKATKKRLYGKDGDLHLAFDHDRFAENMKKCQHKWLITYDDAPKIRELFSFAHIHEWELQYGMNNFKQEHANKGKELFICNYDFESSKKKEVITTIEKPKRISLDSFMKLH